MIDQAIDDTPPLFDPFTMDMQLITLPDGDQIPFTFRTPTGSTHGWAYLKKPVFDFVTLIYPPLFTGLIFFLVVASLIKSLLMVVIIGSGIVLFAWLFASHIQSNKSHTGSIFYNKRLIEVRFEEDENVP